MPPVAYNGGDDGAEEGAEPDGALADGAVTAEVLSTQGGHVVAGNGAGHDVRRAMCTTRKRWSTAAFTLRLSGVSGGGRKRERWSMASLHWPRSTSSRRSVTLKKTSRVILRAVHTEAPAHRNCSFSEPSLAKRINGGRERMHERTVWWGLPGLGARARGR